MKPAILISPDVLKVFDALPDLYLVLSPDLQILAASETFLIYTLTNRTTIVDKFLWEAFPGPAGTAEGETIHNLIAALQEAVSTKKPQQMTLQRYDLHQPGGGRLVRYWNHLNTPVLDEQGEVQYIIHKLEDVTEMVTRGQWVEDLKLEALKQLQKANHILNTLDAAFIELDREYRCVYLNPKAESFLGVQRQVLLGQRMWDVVPEERGSKGHQAIVKAYTQGIKVETEYKSPFNQKWTYLSAVPSQGGAIIFMYNKQEIWESQEKLRENEQLLREAEAAGHTGSYEGDITTMSFRFSDGMYRLLGQEPQSLIPTLDWIDSVSHPEDAMNIRRIIGDAVRDIKPYQYLRRIYRPDGKSRYIFSKGNIICDAEGKAVKILGTAQDITEQKRAEEQLLKHLTILQQSEELAQTGSWEYDLSSGMFTWSEGMYRLFGIEKDSPVTPDIFLDFVIEEDKTLARKIVHNIITEPQPFEESFHIQRSGNVHTIIVRSIITFDTAGMPLKVLGVNLDVTEVKRLEAENLQMRLDQQKQLLNAILEAQEEERRRIAESLHNGVGQLLYATKLNLDRVNLNGMPENKRKAKEALQNTSELLTEAIREIRQVSYELIPALLKDFGLATAVEDLCAKFSRSPIHLRCQIEGISKRLDSYRELAIYRISQELVNNMVRHSEATESSLYMGMQGDTIVLEAEDNGKGFIHPITKAKGIGLKAITDRIELLKGSLDITTAPDRGCKFTIRIPAS